MGPVALRRTPAPPRAIGLLFAALTIGSGSFGAAFWLGRDRGPEASAFPPAAAYIRQHWASGDLLLLVPFYATRGRELLGDLHPVAPRDPLAEDFAAHRRVWVLGLFGEGNVVGEQLATAGLRRVDHQEPAPGITVDLFEVERPRPVRYDFVRALRSARVFHEHPDVGLEPCDRWDEKNGQGGPLGRWLCPHDGEWFYAAPEWHRMGDHLRLCLWAHPPTGGRLVIKFPNVPLGGAAQLFGHGGHTLNSSVYARERIDLDVEVEGLRPQRFSFGLEEHWRPFALALPNTTTATISFAVSSPDAGANHFCFAADLRGPPEAAR